MLIYKLSWQDKNNAILSIMSLTLTLQFKIGSGCINACLSKVQTKVCAGTQHHASKLVYMLLPKRVTQIYQNEAQA